MTKNDNMGYPNNNNSQTWEHAIACIPTFIHKRKINHLTIQCALSLVLSTANNLPLAREDAFVTAINTPVSGTVATNDIPSLDGGNVWTVVAQPSHGTVSLGPTGLFTYTPAVGYTGTDLFTYKITDANGDVSQSHVDLTIVGMYVVFVTKQATW